MQSLKFIDNFNQCTTVSSAKLSLQSILEQAEFILQHCSLRVADMTMNKLQKQATR